MSDLEVERESSTSFKIPCLEGKQGEDYGLWRIRLRAICPTRGVWSVGEKKRTTEQSEPSSGTTENISSATRSTAKREKASGIIISELGDAPLRVVIEAEDDPARMIQLLDARYASNRTVSRIAVQTQLFRMSYSDQDMASYVDQFSSLFS